MQGHPWPFFHAFCLRSLLTLHALRIRPRVGDMATVAWRAWRRPTHRCRSIKWPAAAGKLDIRVKPDTPLSSVWSRTALQHSPPRPLQWASDVWNQCEDEGRSEPRLKAATCKSRSSRVSQHEPCTLLPANADPILSHPPDQHPRRRNSRRGRLNMNRSAGLRAPVPHNDNPQWLALAFTKVPKPLMLQLNAEPSVHAAANDGRRAAGCSSQMHKMGACVPSMSSSLS